jgi:hypothetical protein
MDGREASRLEAVIGCRGGSVVSRGWRGDDDIMFSHASPPRINVRVGLVDGWMDAFIYPDLSHRSDTQATYYYISSLVSQLYMITFLTGEL